jgi:GT2 family glycosyltransferase
MAIHRTPDQDRYDMAEDMADLHSPADSDLEPDPWAWAAQEADDGEQVDVRGCQVTAVLVTMDAARWLPGTLAGLAGLTQRPTRLIAIDNGSTDGTRDLLDRAQEQGLIAAVYAGQRSYGFGTAISDALEQDRSSSYEDMDTLGLARVSEDDTHWLWLLHDDASPAPDALYRLLAQVTLNPEIDVTGPKLLLPRSRQSGQRLAEVGISISGTGRREPYLDPGEIDQGQRDQPQQRLGVSTCGMLVRREVWDDLGGLDKALPVFRDGVEFGWRANLHGYVVVTTPLARFTHRQVGRAGLRPKTASGRRPGKVDRQLGMLVVAAHAPRALLPLIWLRLVVSCLLHAIGYLVGKAPGRSMDEVAALGSFVVHPGRILAARRRVAAMRLVPGADDLIATLRPPWWSSLRTAAESVAGLASDRYRKVAGESDAATLDELTGDDFSSVGEEKPRPPWLNPVVLTTVAAVVASLVAARSLIGRGALAGPALLPAAPTLAAAWHAALDAIPGAPGQSAPPWLAFVAVGSTLLAGQPEWFVTLLICGIVPLSLAAAYLVTRRMIATRRIRLWIAGTYALLPVLLGATNQGRLALSVVALGLPLLVLAVRALALRRVRTAEAWRGGWGAGVVLVALVAFEPSMIIFALLAGLLGALALRRAPRKIGRIAIALAVPVLVLAPWLPSLLAAPGRLLVGPDAALDKAPAAPPVWQLLIGRGLGPGLPPLWLSAVVLGVVWLAALVGLIRQPRRRAVLGAWATALLALGMAVVLSRLVVSVPPVGTEVRPWVGSYLLIAFGALAFAGGSGLDDLPAQLSSRSFSWLQPASVLAGIAVGLVTLTGAGWWVWSGASGPIARVRLNAIPPYVLNAAAAGTRVLAIDLSGGQARYSVIDDDQIRLGDADRGFTFGGSRAARSEAEDLVVRLVAGTADSDLAPQLAELGIGYLWVGGAEEDEQARIDNTPGLGTASGNERGIVWQLDPPASRAVVIDEGSRTPLDAGGGTVPAGTAGRQLLAGEAADPRWQATLNGNRLPSSTAGWQQAFVLPADGGSVSWMLRTPWQWLLLAQLAALMVAGVLAAPAIRRPEVRDPTKSARRAAIGTEVAE